MLPSESEKELSSGTSHLKIFRAAVKTGHLPTTECIDAGPRERRSRSFAGPTECSVILPTFTTGVTGQGLNDYDALFGILAEHHYQGWVSIEDAMNGMEEMAESLTFLRRMSATHFPR